MKTFMVITLLTWLLTLGATQCNHAPGPTPAQYHAMQASQFNANPLTDLEQLEAELSQLEGVMQEVETRVERTENTVDRVRMRELVRVPEDIVSGRPDSQ